MAITVRSLERPADDDDDAAAQEEAALFGNDDLERVAAVRDAARAESYRDQIKWAITIVFWIAVLSFCAALVTLVWHYLTPCTLHWLSDKQTEKVQTIVFTSAAASSVKFFANKYI